MASKQPPPTDKVGLAKRFRNEEFEDAGQASKIRRVTSKEKKRTVRFTNEIEPKAQPAPATNNGSRIVAPKPRRPHKISKFIEHLENSDMERFSRVDVAMAINGLAIDDLLTSTHAEIERRVASGSDTDSDSESLVAAKKHLLDSPPDSPTKYTPPGKLPPVDTADYTPEYDVARLTFSELLFQDNRIHDLKKGTAGLREWWHSTKLEWIRRRKSIYKIDQHVVFLKARQSSQTQYFVVPGKHFNQAEADAKRHEEVISRQIRLQESMKDDQMKWFKETKLLMDKVYLQFLKMKDETRIHVSPTHHIFREQTEGFDVENAIRENINQSTWRRKGSFNYMLREMALKFRHLDEYITSDLNKAIAQRNRCTSLQEAAEMEIRKILEASVLEIESLDQAIEQIRQDQLNNPTTTPFFNVEIALKNDEKRKVRADSNAARLAINDDLQVLEIEQRLCEAMVVEISQQDRINRRIAGMAHQISTTFPDDLKDISAVWTAYIDSICLVNLWRSNLTLSLNTAIESDRLTTSDKEILVNFLEGNPLNYQRLVAKLLVINVNDEIWVKDLYDALYDEYVTFRTMLRHTQDTVRMRTIQDREDTELNIGEDNFSDKVSNNTKQWGQITTLPQAESVLSRSVTYISRTDIVATKSVQSLLDAIFHQPNLSTNFRTLSSKTPQDFLDHVNSFFEMNITIPQMEAFLVYCNHHKELFKYNLFHNVVPVSSGWEAVDEALYGGPVQKFTLFKTEWDQYVEKIMVEDCQALGLMSADRDISVGELIDRFNKRQPLDKRISVRRLIDAIGYWHLAGKLFSLPCVNNPNARDQMIRRIDNGWNFPNNNFIPGLIAKDGYGTQYPATRALILERPILKLISGAVIASQPLTDRSLYALLKPHLHLLGWLGSRNTMSFWKFYLFLRWCSERDDLFKIYRGGLVEISENGWGDLTVAEARDGRPMNMAVLAAIMASRNRI